MVPKTNTSEIQYLPNITKERMEEIYNQPDIVKDGLSIIEKIVFEIKSQNCSIT